jgi:hypothetical protein
MPPTRTDPALLIAAGDVQTEQYAAAYIRGGASHSVELWTVPGAGHTQGLSTAPHEWGQRVTTFLDQALSDTLPDRAEP